LAANQSEKARKHAFKKKMIGSGEVARAVFDPADGSLVITITPDKGQAKLVDTNVRIVEEDEELRVLVELRGDIRSERTWEFLPTSGFRRDENDAERSKAKRAATSGGGRFGAVSMPALRGRARGAIEGKHGTRTDSGRE
jgi:hypothetical protein